MTTTAEPQLTHKTPTLIEFSDKTKQLCDQIRTRLETQENLKFDLPKTLSLLDELSQCYLGRFLLHNKGLNGYWTSYVFTNEDKTDYENDLESWLFNRSLLVAARERLSRFKTAIQQRLQSGMHLASIPSGLMDDLLTLDYSGLDNIKLTAIDADVESLAFARDNAYYQDLNQQLTLLHRDAWQLGIKEEFDLISSNGLNMYESSETRLIQLYQNFYDALKPGGTLLISFLPPPPDGTDPNYSWDNFKIAPEDLLTEQALFQDIIQINYLNFCTEEAIISQVESVGFTVEEVNYSETGICPILIVTK